MCRRARARAAGIDVHFIDTNTKKVHWGNVNGVGVEGRGSLPATFIAFDDWEPGPDSIILLCTKCYCNAAVLARTPSTATIIPIQNGFDPDLEARHHPFEGISSFVSECDADRPLTRVTRRGRLFLGSRDGRTSNAEKVLVAPLRETKLFSLMPVDDILPFKYTKLMYNAAISPLAAAAGIDNGQLLRYPQVRRLFFRLLAENYSILRAQAFRWERSGLSIPTPSPGSCDCDRWPAHWHGPSTRRCEALTARCQTTCQPGVPRSSTTTAIFSSLLPADPAR